MAVTKYLDKTGLTYFWSKIKAWCNSIFALDSSVVHKTGNETIADNKTFTSALRSSVTGTYHYVSNPNLEKGIPPDNQTNFYFPIGDKTIAGGATHYFAAQEVIVRIDGEVVNRLYAFKNEANNSSDTASISLVYPASGDPYATAPSTPSTGNNTDIVTRDWIPKDTRLVHRTENEQISGDKSFESTINIRHSTAKGTNPSGSTSYKQLNFSDSTGTNVAGARASCIESAISTSGQTSTYMRAYNWVAGSGTNAAIAVHYPKNGTAYTEAPTPSDVDDNSTKIATTAWAFPRLAKFYDAATSATLDLNDFITPGVYTFSGSTSNIVTNIPEGVNGTLLVIGNSVSIVRQIWFRLGTNDSTDHRIFVRQRNWLENNSWSTWTRLFTSKDTIPVANGGTGGTTREEAQNGVLRPIVHTSGSFDLNDYTLSSIHVFGATNTTLTNCPDGYNGLLVTFGHTNTITKQFWSRYGTFDANDHYLGFRTGNGEGTWSSWHKLYTDNDVIPIANGGTGSSTQNFVDLSTNQSIGGTKTFSSTIKSTATNTIETTINATIADASRTSRLTKQLGIVTDSGGKMFAALEAEANTDGSRSIYFLMRNRANSGYISGYHLYEDSSGTVTLRLNHSIVRNGNLVYSGATSGTITMYNGTQASDGAGIWLYGKTHSTRPGWASLQTSDGTSYYGFIIEPVNKYARFTNTITEVRCDNKATLGSQNVRWGVLYTTGNVNVGSDERIKQQISAIPDKVLDAWENTDWCQFKLNEEVEKNGNDKANLHTGLIAQRVSEVLTSVGIDPLKYGFIDHASWDATPEQLDEEGNVIVSASPAGDEYSICYVEALCIEAAYQRRKNKILENRISELEKQVSDMIILLQNLTNGNG